MSVVLQVPASPAQQRLWAIEQDLPGTTQFNVTVEVVLPEPMDAERVRHALADVVERHEALRTDVIVIDGRLQQLVRATAPVAVTDVDLSALPAESAETRYAALFRHEESTPFDLTVAPLLRLCHVRRSPEDGGSDDVYDTLVLTVHHLVCDAVSMEILVEDLTTALRVRALAQTPQWEAPAAQYADYSAWLAERSQGDEAEQDREYWRQHLADVAELDLSYGRIRPATPSDRGGAVPVDLHTAQVQAIQRLAKAQRATTFMVLLAAYTSALSRVFNETDVAVGMAVTGRALPEVAHTVGLFTERLVLRIDTGGRPTFRQLVDRARDEVLDAFDHDHLGFDEIVDTVNPPRRYGVTPLAQASINVHGAPVPGSARPGSTASAVRRARIDTVRHDIALTLVEAGGSLEGGIEYRSEVVDDDTARRVARVFRAVLTAGLRAPDARVDAVAAVTPDEVRRLHAEQDGGYARAERSLLERVLTWATDTPAADAVDGPDGRLTYEQLVGEAAAVAARLEAVGVVPGVETPVVVAVPRCTALPVSMIACWLAGAVFVPVDPRAPAPYLGVLVESIGARVAIVGADSDVELPATVTKVPVGPPVDRARAALDSAHVGSRLPQPWSAAYIVFTSGSTGTPKAVTVEHRNLAAYLGGLDDVLGSPPGAVHLLVQPPTFDSSLTVLGGSLATGGSLRIVDEDAARDPVLLAELLTERPVDYVKITPSHLAALLSGANPEVLRPRRAVVLGGELARRDLSDRLQAAGWTVVGHYGPSETTVGVLVHELEPGAERLIDSVALGRPLPGVRVHVLDEIGDPVPPGCRGELCVGGALVSRGYAGTPGRTAAAFVPDPYGPDHGGRLYRTGDLVRRLPDGTFQFCGRRDAQVKLRGHRVEPAMVEHVFAGLLDVAEAVVTVQEDRLVAYVVPAGPGVEPDALRHEVAARLPAYLVPDAVVTLDRLPLTAAGKLDLVALPEVAGAGAAGVRTGPAVPFSTATEERLASLWAAVVAAAPVSATDGFFDVGGDSIRAIYLVAQARAQGLPLTARDVFEHQTLRAMAARIDAVLAEAPVAPVGVAGRAAPTVVRLASAVAADGAESAAAAHRPGVTVTRGEGGIDVAADPSLCDDHALSDVVQALAAASGDRDAGVPAHDVDAPDQELDGEDATTEVVRLRLAPATATAFLTDAATDAGSIHDAYGTKPPDLAAAAVVRALSVLAQGVEPAAEPLDGVPVPGEDITLLLVDVQPPEPVAVAGAQGSRTAVALTMPAHWRRLDAGALLQHTRSAIIHARTAAQDVAVDALAGRDGPPPLVLRVLGLPSGATVVDPGTGSPVSPPDRPGATGRTTVLIAGADVLVVPAHAAPAAGGAAPAPARALAEAVVTALDELVAHCRTTRPVYSPGEFPDSGLDDTELTRVLHRVGAALPDEHDQEVEP